MTGRNLLGKCPESQDRNRDTKRRAANHGIASDKDEASPPKRHCTGETDEQVLSRLARNGTTFHGQLTRMNAFYGDINREALFCPFSLDSVEHNPGECRKYYGITHEEAEAQGEVDDNMDYSIPELDSSSEHDTVEITNSGEGSTSQPQKGNPLLMQPPPTMRKATKSKVKKTNRQSQMRNEEYGRPRPSYLSSSGSSALPSDEAVIRNARTMPEQINEVEYESPEMISFGQKRSIMSKERIVEMRNNGNFNLDPLENYVRLFFNVMSTVEISESAMATVWNLTLVERGTPDYPSYATAKRIFSEDMPQLHFRNVYINKALNRRVEVHQTDVRKQTKFDKDKQFSLVSEFTFVCLKELVPFIEACHSNRMGERFVLERTMDLHVDGVPYGNSTVCCHLYTDKNEDTVEHLLELVIDEIIKEGLELRFVVGDAPIRCKLRNAKQFNSDYSCELCFAKGEMCDRTHVYPKDSMFATERTNQAHHEIVELLSTTGEESYQGIRGKSPLMRIPNFDMVKQILPDPFHLLFLGICKALIKSFVGIQKKRQNMTAMGIILAHKIDSEWLKIKMPSELQRGARSVVENLIHFKGSEFKSLIGCGMFAVANAMHSDRFFHALRKIWILFTYLVMFAFMPDSIYNKYHAIVDLEKLHATYYKLYQKHIGKSQCTYNVHLFHHLQKIRSIVPLHEISAEPYEAWYSKMNKYFFTGTPNIGKQILTRSMKKMKQYHSCKRIVSVNPNHETSLHVDDLLFTKQELFFKVKAVIHGFYICNRIITEDYVDTQMEDLNYSAIGVYKIVGESEMDISIPTDDVIGKAVISGNIISALTMSFLLA